MSNEAWLWVPIILIGALALYAGFAVTKVIRAVNKERAKWKEQS